MFLWTQGGFGITYAAENTRIGMKVAIKELFWRGHSVRSEEAPPEVALANEADGPVFEEQKARFLREARTIRDFSGQAGVIHRDISPDNIMVQPDGSLKLIDFGAARQYMDDGARYTSISRDSYSPGEQYDKNGRQGPWTDVYALCATLYAGVCGAPPQSAIQRMFLDELKAPSELGIDIKPAYEAILMKGLQLRPEKRFQSMNELARAIRAALPEEKPVSGNRRGLLIGLLAGLLCAAVAIGAWAWHRYDVTHKFRGVETELLRAEAAEDVTASEFVAAQDELRDRLENFAGKDNYILTVDGTSLWVTLPLECFENRDIPVVLGESFTGLVPDKDIHWWYDAKANWEDPAHSLICGANQVLPSALKGETVIFRYGWDDELTAGQRANLIVDFHACLDALGVPYAFGTAYGNDNTIMFRIGIDRMGDLIQNTLGETYPLGITATSGYSFLNISSSERLEVIKENGTAKGLRYITNSDRTKENIEAYTRAMLDAGLETLCLCDRDGNPIARGMITEPVTDGTLEFRDFCLEGIDASDPDALWVLDYLVTLVNQTALPDTCTLQGWEYIGIDGNPRLDNKTPEYGLIYRSADDPQLDQLRQQLRQISDDYGYFVGEQEDGFWILLDLPKDDDLPKQIEAILPGLLEELLTPSRVITKRVFIRLAEEIGDDRCRLVFSMNYDYSDKCFKTKCDLAVWGDSVELWKGTIRQWFDTFYWATLGVESSILG